jgi:hypothetical protein
MVYVREKRIRAKGGKVYRYYQVVDGYREGAKVKQRVIAHLGKHPSIEAAREAAKFITERPYAHRYNTPKEREGDKALLLEDVLQHARTPYAVESNLRGYGGFREAEIDVAIKEHEKRKKGKTKAAPKAPRGAQKKAEKKQPEAPAVEPARTDAAEEEKATLEEMKADALEQTIKANVFEQTVSQAESEYMVRAKLASVGRYSHAEIDAAAQEYHKRKEAKGKAAEKP